VTVIFDATTGFAGHDPDRGARARKSRCHKAHFPVFRWRGSSEGQLPRAAAPAADGIEAMGTHETTQF